MLLLRHHVAYFSCVFATLYVCTTAYRVRSRRDLQISCCCQDGKCDARNVERERKMEIAMDGNDFCCKPRQTLYGWCGMFKYKHPLVSIVGDLADQYASNCTRECPDTCSGHGHPVLIQDDLVQNCGCECEEGYNPNSGCAECVDGYAKDIQGQCKVKCTSGDIDCHGNGMPRGLHGACSCECTDGHDPNSKCAECTAGYGKDTDGQCQLKCTETDIVCHGHGVPQGLHGKCNCDCIDGYDPESNCAECVLGYAKDADGQCKLKCNENHIVCNGHGVPKGFHGDCSCSCDDGYDPENNCAECLLGYANDVDGQCKLKCTETHIWCNGHGVPQDFHGDCSCSCADGYDPEKNCSECVLGYAKDTDGQCKLECTKNNLNCNGHGVTQGFHGDCSCKCTTGYDTTSNCADCLSDYGKDIDGECKLKCTENHITCNGHGTPEGFIDSCACTCDLGRDPATRCSTCLNDWVMADDDSCYHPSSLSICIVTLNEPGGLEVAESKLRNASKGCGDVDILVVATQELTRNTPPGVTDNRFNEFALNLSNYLSVARCGGEISAGVVVLVRKEKRAFFTGKSPHCNPKIVDEFTEKSWSNTKGSAVVAVRTVTGGALIAASTHGDRFGNGIAGTFKATAQIITPMIDFMSDEGPTIVAWGGDFNPRTQVDNVSEDLLSFGATHPTDPWSGGEDTKPEWKQTFNPVKAYETLAALPDIMTDTKTFATVLDHFSQRKLVQVDGIRQLCPTYRKAEGPGRKSSGRFGRKRREWRPNFACQSPGSEVEYFKSPLDQRTKWSGKHSRAPSWTERLIVNKELQKGCEKPGKVRLEKDHDVLYVQCKLSSVLPLPTVSSNVSAWL